MITTSRSIRAISAAVLLMGAVSGCGSEEPSGSAVSTTTSAPEPTTQASTTSIAEVTDVKVYFVDSEAYGSGVEPYVRSVIRTVDASDPIAWAMRALFAGPDDMDQEDGLELVSSGATGATVLSIESGVARVQLVGGCDSGGSTMTIAAQILPTLKQFDEVDTVKLMDPDGTTIDDDSPEDSTPECLEP